MSVKRSFNIIPSFADLEKCVTFFNAMYSVLLANDNLTNEVQLIRDYTASITSACDAVSTDCASMQALIQVGVEMLICFDSKLKADSSIVAW